MFSHEVKIDTKPRRQKEIHSLRVAERSQLEESIISTVQRRDGALRTTYIIVILHSSK